jgi:hypothetical protein
MTIYHSASNELQGRSGAGERILAHGEHMAMPSAAPVVERRSEAAELDLDDLVRAIRALLDS